MFRRLVPFRRSLAVAMVGLALGACADAGDNVTAPPGPEAAAGAPNPLNFSLSRSTVFVPFTGQTPPAPQTVDVSGIVVSTTPYVRVLGITYSPSNITGWIQITQRPTPMADGRLGVRLTFTTRYVPGVELGASATIPVTVPGARNGPQTITLTTNPLNCTPSGNLAFPSQNPLIGTLQVGDCLGRLQEYETPPNLTQFDLYTLTVPGNTSFTIYHRGVPSNAGTNPDPYLYLWDPVTNTSLAQNDDGGGGINNPRWDSRIYWTNSSASAKLYFVLAGRCCGGGGPQNVGTYTLDVWSGNYTNAWGSPPVASSASTSGSEVVFRSAEEARAYVQKKARQAAQ